MQYVLTLSGREASFIDGHSAGAAYARADISLRPSVAIRSAGLTTTIAQARPAGMYEDGTLRAVKSMPRNSAPGASDFARGYFQQLTKQLGEQLATVDWKLAKPTTAFQVPKLPGSI